MFILMQTFWSSFIAIIIICISDEIFEGVLYEQISKIACTNINLFQIPFYMSFLEYSHTCNSRGNKPLDKNAESVIAPLNYVAHITWPFGASLSSKVKLAFWYLTRKLWGFDEAILYVLFRWKYAYSKNIKENVKG